MIDFNFIYLRPDSLKAAADVFLKLKEEGKNAVYYSGGSEIISMCRTGAIKPDAVIDIKSIPECRELKKEESLYIGSACTLNDIGRSDLFPLLRLAGGRIADHTNQCKITLGGNLCGTIIYREASLPLLLADADVTLYGTKGERTVPMDSIFDERMRLKAGEMIVGLHVPLWALSARHFHIKKAANEKIDYPFVSIAAICKGDRLRIGFSGVCSYPFRSDRIEEALNDRAKSHEERVELAVSLLPEPPMTDSKGSGEYRIFVLKNTLLELLKEWENGQV